MARSRGFRQVPVRSSPKRLTSWEEGPGGTAALGLSASTIQFLGAALTPTQDGLTQIRLRGRLSWFLTLATSAGDGFQGAFGIGKATAAAVLAGTGSVPTPITEQAWDGWLYWTPISIHGAVVSSTALGNETKQDFEIDTKAMRKLYEEDSIYAMIEIVEIGTATATMFFDSRILFKLA